MMSMERALCGAGAAVLVLGTAGAAEQVAGPRTLAWTTASEAAKTALRQLRGRIECFQFGPDTEELARRVVAADPDFAMGAYYLSAIIPPPENQQYLDRAVELAGKASGAERRFIEAMVQARGQTPQDALEPLRKLGEEYPAERPIQMILGQLYLATDHVELAQAAFERARSIDDSTPRALAFLGDSFVLEGDYARARALFESALSKLPKGTAAFGIRHGIACTHLYEGNPEPAIESLYAYLGEYLRSGAATALPEVFIWNTIARVQLEFGRLEQALASYQKGYETVTGSSLAEDQKQLWLGRFEHGKGRVFARLGRHDEAWQTVLNVKAMIDGGGAEAQQYLPAYHYLAGYVLLEAGEPGRAATYLELADQLDPFQQLLLGRAYERIGEAAKAQGAYRAILESTSNTLDRALAYPEAKHKLGE